MGEAIDAARRRTEYQISALERNLAGIVAGAELTSTDDEHDPEGATIAYERAQVTALLHAARGDLVALEAATHRLDADTITTCSVCGGLVALERVLALPTTSTCIHCSS